LGLQKNCRHTDNNQLHAAVVMTVMATAAADGMVWGRRQATEAAEMGIKQKWKQCGCDRRKFISNKIV
jgi:hypothetical protein